MQKTRLCLIGVVGCLVVAAPAHAQTTLYTFNRDSGGDLLLFGVSVSGAGDVNADGFDDLIVGAPFHDNNGSLSGSARVFSGLDGSILYTFDGDSAGDQFGFSVSGAGDVNADGFDDLIVGAPSGSGSARVFSGLDGSILFTFNADSAFDRFGHSVSGAGDVNGDGFPDLIVGAIGPQSNVADPGSARVFSGLTGSILYTFDGDSTEDESGFSDQFGFSVSGAGDVNGDGFADLIVGAHLDDNNGTDSGSVQVFSGLDGSILYTFDGDSAGGIFGHSVSGAGDVNADGFADLIVGARSGSARVFSGLDGSILYTFNGDSAGDRFGESVSGAGDVNGDGFADLIVGAPADDNNGTDSGSARVFSGLDGSIFFTFDGDLAIDRFGLSVSGAGDVDGDGFDDLIVGAVSGFTGPTGNRVSARVISPAPGVLVIDLIAAVVDLNLQEGIENSLVAMLDAAIQILQDMNQNNDGAALNLLSALVTQVENQSGNQITEAQAALLIGDALEIIDLLSAG